MQEATTMIPEERIHTELKRIESEEKVRILYACESGSRAWGFPSQDSDYDVRFLYAHPTEWYLSVHPGRDVIERPISAQLDLSGWDIRKALQLLAKSNPPLLEWLHSPIRYLEWGTVVGSMREMTPDLYSPRSSIHHYLHLGEGNFRDYLQGERVRLKKYFYVLRSVLACQWLAERGGIPPVAFRELIEALLPAGELKDTVEELLRRKRSGEEMDSEPPIPLLHRYLEQRLVELREQAGRMPQAEMPPESLLDAWFRAALRESDAAPWTERSDPAPR